MKHWYAIQAYAGYEESLKADLTRRLQDKGLQDYVGEILVPLARSRSSFVTGQADSEQLFPGYVLIEMEIVPGLIPLIKSSPRVLRILGNDEPISLSKREVDRIVSQIRGDVVVVSAGKCEFVAGAEIEIQEGPFAGFVGIVDKIDAENERLTVMVSIFGRMTPVELNFNQVKH